MPNPVEVASLQLTGGLFSGPPAYQIRASWKPKLALLAIAIVLGSLAPLFYDKGQLLNAVYLVLTIGLTLVASRLGGRVYDVLALGRPTGGWRTYAVAGIITVFLSALYLGVLHMREGVFNAPPAGWSLEWALLAIQPIILAPVLEELQFRGLVLSALASTGPGFWGAAVVSTALWTAVHLPTDPFRIAWMSTLGLFHCWLVWRTGSVRVPIFCHALCNFTFVLALRFVHV